MINISVRSNIHNTDVQLLQREASYFFHGEEEIAFYRTTEQIDSGFISITADVLAATAAFLYIYIELVQLLRKVGSKDKPAVEKSKLDYVNPTRLRRLIEKHFDIEELRTLCVDLGIDYDSLRGEGKTAKARELIAYLERHARIHELVNYVRDQRSGISWSDISQELSYDELSADARKIMAERGVTEVEIIDIIGFPDKAHVNLDKPCIITFLDSKTNTPFKVFYHSSENTYEIRIART